MVAAFVVLLREGFEASLLVAIVLAYLTQIGHPDGRRRVWYGVGAAILVSLVLSGVMFATVGELRGPSEKIFEACALFLAVGFLTYMVLWMRRESRSIAGNIRRDVDSAVGRGGGKDVRRATGRGRERQRLRAARGYRRGPGPDGGQAHGDFRLRTDVIRDGW